MYGKRILKKDDSGDDVQELQIRLSGFSGTVPDGEFGPGTESQVLQFQRIMNIEPSGIVDEQTFQAIDFLSYKYPIDFNKLKCPCGVCKGFGQGLYKGEYLPDKPKIEQYYLYEYPGIHRVILWSFRALMLYMPNKKFFITSGYRCSVRNDQMKRTSTNHKGKAIDVDIELSPNEDKQNDLLNCNQARSTAEIYSKAQIGWSSANLKSLEPKDIAPTWIHYDVRSYEPKYLEDRFFCRNSQELDGIKFTKLDRDSNPVISIPETIVDKEESPKILDLIISLIKLILKFLGFNKNV
jgi:hypothetical protein